MGRAGWNWGFRWAFYGDYYKHENASSKNTMTTRVRPRRDSSVTFAESVESGGLDLLGFQLYLVL